jgi:hypothetical protein
MAEEDATFCLIKDGTFFLLFSFNEPGTEATSLDLKTRRFGDIHV